MLHQNISCAIVAGIMAGTFVVAPNGFEFVGPTFFARQMINSIWKYIQTEGSRQEVKLVMTWIWESGIEIDMSAANTINFLCFIEASEHEAIKKQQSAANEFQLKYESALFLMVMMMLLMTW